MAPNPPPDFHARESPRSTFVEHKKPRFSFPETPKDRAPSPLRPRPPMTPAARSLPKFTISPQTESARAVERTRPAFKRGAPQDDDEICLTKEKESHHIHNPFDVSEELEEEIIQPAYKRSGPPRFITDIQCTHQSRVGTSRTTTDILSSIRIGHKESKAQAQGGIAVVSSDWSPHKKKLKQGEHLKFTKGGMAETVALWIYEAQCDEE